ncbi:hypothetical protein [Ruegeria sp. ANG-R]|uniref:hypothetical protein n=1 Tax=Ruegeria sp. ANG-R TaxID=1577903 RepID=UPI001269FE86|nr:hypothetical protein [Ruegeria sp. ANG-R]
MRRRTIAGSMVIALSFGALQAQELPVDDLTPDFPPEDLEDVPADAETGVPRFTRPDEAEPDSARTMFLDFREEFRYSDNPDLEADDEAEDVFTARTTLQGGYIRRTAIDSFELLFGADLDLRTDDEGGIERPRIDLGWARDVGNSNIGLSLGYSEFDLGTDTGSFFNSDTGSIDFGTFDRGTRETSDIAIEGGFGLERPFGGNYLLSHREIRYNDTDDPGLLNADRFIAEGDLFFVLTPRFTVGLEAGRTDFDEDGEGALDTITTYYRAFADTQIDSRTRGRFSLGWEEVDESGEFDNVEDGVVFGIELARDTPRGENFLNIDSRITTAGRQTELRLGQTIEQSTRELGYSIGMLDTEGADTEPLFGLRWAEELPRGVFNTSLEMTPFSDRDGETQINTLFTVGYGQEITTRSGFSVDISYLDVNNLDTDSADTQRLDLSLTYSYALTEDWNLVSGVSFARLEEDDEEDRDANTVFVGIERRFVWN